MIKASEVFTCEELDRIKFVLKLFNGRVVCCQRREFRKIYTSKKINHIAS